MKLFQIYLRSIAVGATDLVPGISGGTMALILGIYERIIQALSNFDWRLWQVFRQQGVRGVFQAVDGTFLLTVLLGAATGLLLMLNLVDWLLGQYELPFKGFIFGLVLGSGFVIGREISSWRIRELIALLLGILLSQLLNLLLPAIGGLSPIALFVAGMIAISAMLLPGISGSFMLLIMGLYGPVVSAVKGLDWGIILPFAAGCALGLMVFSHLLVWLFRHYHQATFALLFGLVIASLRHIWPWQQVTRYQLDEQGQMLTLQSQAIAPWHYAELMSTSMQLLPVLLLCLTGTLLVAWLARHNP